MPYPVDFSCNFRSSVLYYPQQQKKKRLFNTKANVLHSLTFLRREPILHIGAFAVKNRFSYRYYILYGSDLSSVAAEVKPPDCKKSGGFFVYILVKPAKIAVFT